jgi:hypothetical protein
MRRDETADLEDFYFFLCENLVPFATSKQFRKSDREKTQEEINRAYNNNVRWSKKILIQLIQRSYIAAHMLNDQIKKEKPSRRRRGLGEWM